jgi:thiol-disulfide isomerase/thioredoxin
MGNKANLGATPRVLKRWLTVFLGMAMLATSTASALAADDIRPAPSCNLKRWDSGEEFDLKSLRGQVVYVDFWASWCSACIESFPFLNELERELSRRGLVVLGINLDAEREDAARFLAKHPVGFSIATNPNRQCPKVFGVPGMPAAYLIDRKGHVRREHLGFRTGQANSLRTLVEQLLSE